MNPSTLRVLVVDDDEEDFLILRDLLSDYPQGRFDLEWAPTLAGGVRALREHGPQREFYSPAVLRKVTRKTTPHLSPTLSTRERMALPIP